MNSTPTQPTPTRRQVRLTIAAITAEGSGGEVADLMLFGGRSRQASTRMRAQGPGP